jgi:hypothetical protein
LTIGETISDSTLQPTILQTFDNSFLHIALLLQVLYAAILCICGCSFYEDIMESYNA